MLKFPLARKKESKDTIRVPQGNEQVFTHNEAHNREEDFHSKKKKCFWDFPGGPVVKTASIAEGVGSIPGHMVWPRRKNYHVSLMGI